MPNRRTLQLLSIAFSICAGCAREHGGVYTERAKADTTNAPHVTAGETASVQDPQVASAKKQFVRFLQRALETAPRTAPKYVEVAIPECDPDGEQGDALWVASFNVLSVAPSGDDMIARAEVTSVAEQHLDTIAANRTVVLARIRADTLEWRMSQRPLGAQWRVCGFATNGYDLGSYGRPELIRYLPADMNRAKLLAEADSIERAIGKR
jgi:hypothetical protein